MGGIGHLYTLTPLPGARQAPLLAVNRKVWSIVDAAVRKVAGQSESAGAVLREYWPDEARDNLANWPVPPDQIGFSFRDSGGGQTAAMNIALHWVEVALCYRAEEVDAALHKLGWALATPLPPLADKLLHPTGYLICSRKGVLYCLHRDDDGITLWADIDAPDPRPSFDALPESDRRGILSQLEARRCECPLCFWLGHQVRKRARLAAEKLARVKQAEERAAARLVQAAERARRQEEKAAAAAARAEARAVQTAERARRQEEKVAAAAARAEARARRAAAKSPGGAPAGDD
jgi:hypothetical protein